MERFFSSLPVVFFVVLSFTLSVSFASANTCTYSCHRASGTPLDRESTGGECTGTDAGPCALGCAAACSDLSHAASDPAFTCVPAQTRCAPVTLITPDTPSGGASASCEICVDACVRTLPDAGADQEGARIYGCLYTNCSTVCAAQFPTPDPVSQGACTSCLQSTARHVVATGHVNGAQALQVTTTCRDNSTPTVRGTCQAAPSTPAPSPSSGGSSGRGSTSRLYNPLGSSNLYQLIARLIRTMTGLVGALALGMFVVGGIIWLTAGDTKRVDLAKEILKNSTIGLILIFLSYAAVSVFLDAVGSISSR